MIVDISPLLWTIGRGRKAVGSEIEVIGHNGGPPIDDDDEPPGKLLFVAWAWRQARKAAFTAPTTEIALFRLARAEAAGLSYDEYVSRLLDTGRHPQRDDRRVAGDHS